ncbi:MAG: 16S rRNA (cytosine(1402)-N(4))-methyltransferase RsmH [Streptosporangiales bacterium]
MPERRGTPRGHVPVLAERVVALLGPALTGPEAVFVDATLGLGGHSALLLERHPDVHLVGLDRDPAAITASRERLARYADRAVLVHAVYDELPDVLADLGLDRVHGVLLDLGVSSVQLDEPERGFAYAYDAPLDMRMDPTTGATAADVVNTYPAGDLTRILRTYGEERHARRIAEAIVRLRADAPFTSTARLAATVNDAVPAAARRSGHPAKRTFQALRIWVNAELDALDRVLPRALASLAVGGRIVVLAYHSLEDRRVKQALRAAATTSAPPDLPVVPPESEPRFRLLTRGAERPSSEELAINPRAASARLRAAERIREEAA